MRFPFDLTNKLPALFLAASIFLIGIGYLAILPPFSGTDEQAHYSSIRQIEETGTLPLLNRSSIAQDVIDYRRHGPMPYYTFVAHKTRKPTYGHEETMTYAEFFASPTAAGDYRNLYRNFSPRAPYTAETEEMNWAAQHPPLYYLLLAPVMKATNALPFVTQIFLLRLFSFVLAFAGLMTAFIATLKYAGANGPPKNYIVAGFLLLPLIGPMFYAEFGRMGNDSLCLFLFGIIWSSTLVWLRDESKKKYAFLIGCCFGLGLLTKAVFIAIFAGFCAFLLARLWRNRKNEHFRREGLRNLVLIVAPALLIGGWWYALQDMGYGLPVGDANSLVIAHNGGLLVNLAPMLTLKDFLNGIFLLLVTWSWFGDGVMAEPIIHLLLLALEVWILVAYARMLRRQPATSIAWLPVWLGVPFFCGLVWQILVSIALSNITGANNMVGGWYFYVLMPASALAASYGLQQIAEKLWKRILLGVLLVYALAFLVFIMWAQASMFSACAVASDSLRPVEARGGSNSFYHFPDKSYCLDRWHDVVAHLSVLGSPYMAAIIFGGGLLCLLLGLFALRKLFYNPRDLASG